MKKTILYIHHGKGLGGAPISLVNLAIGIKKAGFHPVVAFLHKSQAVDLFKDAGIEIIEPMNIMDFSHTKIYWFRWYHPHHILRCLIDTLKTIFIVAPRLYEKIQPDIIHLNTSSLLGWGIAARKKNIPVVWHIREPLAAGYLGLRKILIQKIIAYYATKIVAICKTDGNPWQKSPKLSIVYNAVSEDIFIPTTTKHVSNPTILFLGGIAEQKGTLFCLQIFEAILSKIPTARLILAGNNSYPERNFFLQKISSPARYHNQCNNLIKKMHQSIILTGPCRNVPDLMQSSSVLISPSSVSHFARPVIEAGFMKMPVVASKCDHQRELIIDKKTGYLLPSEDINTWVLHLCKLFEDNALRTNMGLNAQKFCQKNFSLSQQVSKLSSIYKSL